MRGLTFDSRFFFAYTHLAPSYFRRCEYRKVRGPSPREVERVPKINDEPIERHFMRHCGGGGADKVDRVLSNAASRFTSEYYTHPGKLAMFRRLAVRVKRYKGICAIYEVILRDEGNCLRITPHSDN